MLLTRNFPLLDSSSRYVVYLGQGSGPTYPQQRTVSFPSVAFPLKTPYTLPSSVVPNADGSINATFTLPQDGAGVLLSVYISIYQGTSNTPVFTTAVALAQTFSYLPPVIPAGTGVVVTRGLFYTPSANASKPGGDYVPCPFPASVAASWSCADPNIFQLTISGQNFGQNPAPQTPLWAAGGGVAAVTDGVLRALKMLALNTSGLVVWANTAPGSPFDALWPATIWLYSWSHTKIIAFAHQSAGSLQLSLTTTSTYLQPNGANVSAVTQAVVSASFANLSPSISSMTGATSNIPTTGSVTATTIIVADLAGAANLGVFIGGDQNTGVPAVIACVPVGQTVQVVPCPDVRANILAPALAAGTATEKSKSARG
jgi:hypothetical protein